MWKMSETTQTFRDTYSLEQRSSEARRIRDKYPDRIPVVVERDPRSDIPLIDKKKYLVPQDLTVGQFMYVIRKRIKLSPEQALFFFTDKNRLPPTACLLSRLYKQEKDQDFFLYLTYASENTFG